MYQSHRLIKFMAKHSPYVIARSMAMISTLITLLSPLYTLVALGSVAGESLGPKVQVWVFAMSLAPEQSKQH